MEDQSGSKVVEKVGIVVESSELLARIEVQSSVLVEEVSERSDLVEKDAISTSDSLIENSQDVLDPGSSGQDQIKVLVDFHKNQENHLNAEMNEVSGDAEQNVNESDIVKEIGSHVLDAETGEQDKGAVDVRQEDNNEITLLETDNYEQKDNILEMEQSIEGNNGSSTVDQVDQDALCENTMNADQVICEETSKAQINAVGMWSAVDDKVRQDITAKPAAPIVKEHVEINVLDNSVTTISVDSTAHEDNNAEKVPTSEIGVNSIVDYKTSKDQELLDSGKSKDEELILESAVADSIANQADSVTEDPKATEPVMETCQNIEEDQNTENTINVLDPAIELQPQIVGTESDKSALLADEETRRDASFEDNQETDHEISMMDVDQDKYHEATNLQSHLLESGINIHQVDNSTLDSVHADGTLNNDVIMECTHFVDEHSINDVNIVIGDDGCLSVIQEIDANHEIINNSINGEEKAQVAEKDLLVGTKKNETELIKNHLHVSYNLPLIETSNFSFSDLVWGKVKSHPWWPGQIFDPSDASTLASKYQKKDAFLIAYYGDKTFAWCDESQLKPFHLHFSQMGKLCNSDTFIKGINDILLEVSRRIVLGMACLCLPKENYANIKYQKIENAGIRGGNIESNIDRSTIANYFQSDKLLEYIKTLALFPNGEVDKLEFVMARSQLKAFYRSKGYSELPVFVFSGGVMEIEAENKEEIVKNGESTLNKINEKQKSVPKLTEDKTPASLVNNGKRKSEAKLAEKSTFSSSGKKRNTIIEFESVDSCKHKNRTLNPFEETELKSPPSHPNITSSFKIGEFIKRAASNLTGGPTVVKCQGEILHKKDDFSDFDVQNQKTNLSISEHDNSTYEMLSQLCIASTDPMNEYSFVTPIVDFFTGFRNFCVSGSSSENLEHVQADKRKRGGPKRLNSQPDTSSDTSLSENEKNATKHEIISQIATDDIGSDDEKPIAKRKRGRPKKNPRPASPDSNEDNKPIARLIRDKPHKTNSQPQAPNTEKRKRGRPKKVITALVDLSAKDSYWSDTNLLKEKSRNKNQVLKPYKRRKSTGQSLELQLGNLNSNMKHRFVAERSIISVDEKIMDERMPTSLFLSFSNANSLPSETDLIRIFSRYGPLKEAETEVLRKTNRAKVVFKRRVDAENAFSSAGKYSIFGPGLLSYQLKPWMPRSILQDMPHETDAAPLDSQDAAEGKQESVPSSSAEENNHDAASIVLLQEKCHVGPTEENNLELSEQVEAVKDSDPMEIEVETKEAMPQSKQDQENQDECDINSATLQVSFVAPSSDTLEAICHAGLIVGSNLETLEQAGVETASDTLKAEAENKDLLLWNHDPENQDEELVTSLLDQHDLTPTTTNDILDAASIDTLQDKHDEGPTVESNLKLLEQTEALVASDAMEEDHDEELVSTPIDQHDNLNATSVTTLQNKSDAGPFEGEQTEAVVASNIMEGESVGKESFTDDKNDPALVDTSQENQDEHELNHTDNNDDLDASLMATNENDAAHIATNENDAAHIATNEDDAAHITMDKNDAAPITTDENDAALVTTNENDSVSITTAIFDAAPVTTDGNVLTPVTADENVQTPVTADENDAAPSTSDENDAAPSTTDANDAAPRTTDENDAAPITDEKDGALTEDACDAAPRTKDACDAAPRTKDACDAAPSTSHANDAAPSTADANDAAPRTADANDAAPSTADANDAAPRTADAKDAAPITTDEKDAALTEDENDAAPSTADENDAEPSTADENDAAPSTADTIGAAPSTADENDAAPITTDEKDAAPRTIDENDAAPITTDEKDAALSEASGSLQAEDEGFPMEVSESQ